MGRIKSTAVKSLADELIKQHPGKYTADFGKNKKILGEMLEVQYKKVRNKLAGQITKRVKQQKAARPPMPRETENV
jgi:small subunit ribosomal protein S17e